MSNVRKQVFRISVRKEQALYLFQPEINHCGDLIMKAQIGEHSDKEVKVIDIHLDKHQLVDLLINGAKDNPIFKVSINKENLSEVLTDKAEKESEYEN